MEQILHYVWKHKLFQANIKTTDGQTVEVLDVGLHNTDEGPDFFNAKIKIDNKIWSGNIEIHTTSEDWFKHKHQHSKTYNSVILHIVEKANKEITNQLGKTIPQCEITYPQHIKTNIEFLLKTDIDVPCCNYIKDYPTLHKQSWMNVLLLERLERKRNDINTLLQRFNNSWADVFYVLLSRSMGFGLNSDSFQRLALSIPLISLLKQADDIQHIEALFFGQAGLLANEMELDEYGKKLQREYLFLQNKFKLKPLEKEIFKKMRARPSNSIYIRIAQLANIIKHIQGLYSKVMKSEDVGQIRLLLHYDTSKYWHTHYSFKEVSMPKNKYIGDTSLDMIIINCVIPLIFAYGIKTDSQKYTDKAIEFLEQLKPESNRIIRQFNSYGIASSNAAQSQAILQLKREYCEKRKCLHCRIGYRLLNSK